MLLVKSLEGLSLKSDNANYFEGFVPFRPDFNGYPELVFGERNVSVEFANDFIRHAYIGSQFTIYPKVPTEVTVVFLQNGNAYIELLKGAMEVETDLTEDNSNVVLELGLSKTEETFTTRAMNGYGFKYQNAKTITVDYLKTTAGIHKQVVNGNVQEYAITFEISVIDNGVHCKVLEITHDFSGGELARIANEERRLKQIQEDKILLERQRRDEEARQREVAVFNERKKRLAEEDDKKEAKRVMRAKKRVERVGEATPKAVTLKENLTLAQQLGGGLDLG